MGESPEVQPSQPSESVPASVPMTPAVEAPVSSQAPHVPAVAPPPTIAVPEPKSKLPLIIGVGAVVLVIVILVIVLASG